ncbi:MAG: lytic transglycosylase domain-containing protein [Betaproteobacteria bacterium]|nr:lytic transglycosylase domain-containing protein [Betaproteobacteria bacterium]
MDREQRIQWLFGVFVRVIGAIRLVRVSSPMLAGLSLAAAGFAVSHLPPPATDFDFPLGGSHPAASLQTVSLIGAPSEQAESERLPALSREQQNLARFITATYRVAASQTHWFVDHAYRTARELKLDPMLILAIISVESSFDPQAQSHRGAQGLMQVLTRVHADKFSAFGGVAAAFDPLANIRVGAQILHDYLRRDGSVERALKAYVGAATLPDDGGYGAKVIFERERMAAAAAGRPVPQAPASAPRRADGSDESVSIRGRDAGSASRVELPVIARSVQGPVHESAAEILDAAPLAGAGRAAADN